MSLSLIFPVAKPILLAKNPRPLPPSPLAGTPWARCTCLPAQPGPTPPRLSLQLVAQRLPALLDPGAEATFQVASSVARVTHQVRPP